MPARDSRRRRRRRSGRETPQGGAMPCFWPCAVPEPEKAVLHQRGKVVSGRPPSSYFQAGLRNSCTFHSTLEPISTTCTCPPTQNVTPPPSLQTEADGLDKVNKSAKSGLCPARHVCLSPSASRRQKQTGTLPRVRGIDRRRGTGAWQPESKTKQPPPQRKKYGADTDTVAPHNEDAPPPCNFPSLSLRVPSGCALEVRERKKDARHYGPNRG